ncbi:PAS domain S-box protein [Singulisphaera sp. PoT]|uniref:PAS domain-containing hybrid sensor histidine kinase/response regulator n=1 Tax=Singulisphaera sp. PoT TaxID=3411797 RepID=UPI003BF4EF6E
MTPLAGILENLFTFGGTIPTWQSAHWPDWLIWEHQIGHAMVWAAFMAIPATLWSLGFKRPNFVRNPRLVRAFAMIIALSGFAHLLDLIGFYYPLHWISGHILILTGVTAWSVLWSLLRAWPDLVALKGPNELEAEVAARTLELRDALAELQALVDCIPNVVWTARADGTLESNNRRWNEASWGSNTGTRLSWDATVHPDDLSGTREAWSLAVRNGHDYEHKKRLRTSSSRPYRWHLCRALPLRDESGAIVKWFGTATDIEDQVRAEEELRRSEAQLEDKVRERTEELARINESLQSEIVERRIFEARQAVELAVSGILMETSSLEAALPKLLKAIGTGFGLKTGEYWGVDADSSLLTRRLVWRGPGASDSNAAGDTGLGSTSPETSGARREALAQVISESGRPCWAGSDHTPEGSRGGPAVIEGDDGCVGFGLPIVGESKKLGALTFWAIDNRLASTSLIESLEILGLEIAMFIERRAAEQKLRDSEQRFRGIFDHTFQFVGLTTPDGRVIEANDTALKFAGVRRDDIVDVPCWETPWVPSEAGRGRLKEAIKRAAAGQFVRYEGSFKGLNGQLIPIDFSVTPLKDESGEVSMLILEGRDTTLQRQAAEALRQSEERFRGAFDAAAIGMALVGTGGQFLQVNRSLCEMLGYSEAELTATSFQAITVPEDLDADLNELQRTLAGEITSYRIDKRYFHRDGRIIWITLNVSLLRDDEGRPLYFVSQIQDITRRKQAEEAQRLSESTIRSLFDGSPLMMGIVELHDDDIFHITGNAASDARMRQYGAEPGRGYYLKDTPAPEPLRLEWMSRYRECASTGQPVRFEYGMTVPPLNKTHWVSATACPIGDMTGPRPRFSYVAEDVTERKAVEQSQSRLNAILEATSDVVTMTDALGRILYLNRAARELLGVGPDEDMRNKFMQTFHPQWMLQKIELEAIPTALRDGLWRGESVFRTRDNREVFTSQVMIVHKSPQGTIDYISTVARDITEEREAERALREVRDQALAATKAKSTFLANMSHEIRTPMNAIVGMAELLLDSKLDEQQYDYATTIRSGADAMLEIVNDILDLSKIEANKMAIETVEFNLGDLVEEVADLMAPRAHQKGLQLSCLVAPELPETLMGDPHRIRQILTNLVGNAVKFTEIGEVTIEVERVRIYPETVDFRVSVHDTGIGIPLEKQDVVFESFTQADGGTTRRHGGTGLGLTICRQLARLMAGTIDLKSEPGVGSTFTVDLCLAKGTGTDSDEASRRSRKVDKVLRALVVDTNGMNRRVVREYLHSFGCRTMEAGSARQALSILREAPGDRPFDAVFLDSRMPEVDGHQFARTIRLEAGMGDLPLVLMSPNTPSEPKLALEADTFTARIFKPIRRSQLLNVLGDILEQRESSLAARRPTQVAATVVPEGGLGLQVLVADDHPTNRKVAVRMLQSLGCTADTVCDGHAAVEAIHRRTYDVVLMDLQMPGMDGLAATAEVRRRERGTGRRTPILAMTAHAMQGDRERCLEAGMDGYISKPVRHKDLRKGLESCVIKLAAPEAEAPEEDAENRPDPMPFRWSALVEQFDGDFEFACTLADSILTTTPGSLDEIRAAIAERDPRRLEAAAHGLKGNCLTIGANSLGVALHEIELAGHRGDIDSAVSPLERVESLWDELKSQLRDGTQSNP